MNWFFPSLRSRLVVLAGLVLLPFCALIIQLGVNYYRFAVDSVYQNVGTLSRMLATAQNEKTENAQQLMMTLARMPAIRDRRGDYCAILADTRKQYALQYVDLGLTDAKGRLLCDGVAGAKRRGLERESWFYQSLEMRRFAIGTYELDAVTGKTVAVVVEPILDNDGRLQGAIFAALDLAWITRFNTLAALPERSIVLMFDRDGLVLRRDPEPERWVGQRHPDAPFIRKMISGGHSGVLEMPALDGIRRLVAFETMPSQNGNVYLAVGVPEAVAFARLRKEFFGLGLIAVLAIIATLAIFWVAAGKLIVNRVDRLALTARRFGQGEYDARSGLPHSPDEIGELASIFDGMAAAIKQRENRLQQYYFALDHHAIVSATDLAGNITFINEKFCEISGYSREELIGQNHRMLNSGWHPAEYFETMWTTLCSGQIWQGVIRNQRKDGSYYWVVSTIVPQLDEHGMPAYYFSIRTDITATLKIKEALELSEQKFRLLAENLQDVVALHELDGRIVYVSPSSRMVLGYDHAEMVGTMPWHAIHPLDLPNVRRELHQSILNGETRASAIFRIRRHSGEYIWVNVKATPVLAPDGGLVRIQLVLRDISARKEAVDSLRLHHMAVQASPSGIMLLSIGPKPQVIYVNPAFEIITGYKSGETVGRGMSRKVRHAVDANGMKILKAAIRDQCEDQVLLRFVRRDGILLWLDCSVAPVRNEKLEVSHFVATFRDMTVRMAMMEELRHAKEASEAANQAKSEFLSRMTHELRTPLNFILGFSQLLEAQPENLSEHQLDGVRRILKSGWHLHELINEVLDLARIESGKLEVQLEDVRLDFLLDECVGIVELMAAERGIRIVTETAADGIEWVRADRMRIRQVLLNLLSNAVKFNCESGTVTITRKMTAAGKVRVSVSDTGPGIDSSRMDELFKPFSRLGADKAQIPGTGIGLAISQHFMHLMGGEIGVSSAPGQGSLFWIDLQDVNECSAGQDRRISAGTEAAIQSDGVRATLPIHL